MPGYIISLVLMACLISFGDIYGQYISSESVVYDAAHSRYLVSDQGNGNIYAVDSYGVISAFTSAPPAVKGLMIRNDTLFCAGSTSGLILFDLETGDELLRVSFPGMADLNDVIGDTSGNIYVSDAQGNKVHKLKLNDLSTELVLDNFDWANGMVFDTVNNRIIICQWIDDCPLSAINLDDFSVEIIRDDSLYYLDGLAWDIDGNLFVSSWGTGDIYVYEPDFFSPPRMVYNGPTGSADIAFNYTDTVLAIPNTNNGSVIYLPMRDPDRDLYFEGYDNCPGIYNPDQDDADNDGVGDICDECTDADGDGFGDPGYDANTCEADLCPDIYDNETVDSDGDFVGDNCDNCISVYNQDQLDNDLDGFGDACDIYGDANSDGNINIGDAVYLINHVFHEGPATSPYETGDANCDSNVNIGDAVFLLNLIFGGGNAPCCNVFCKLAPPDNTALGFLPEIISSEDPMHGKLSFSPNESEVYWSTVGAKIFYSTFDGTTYTEPEQTSFDGTYPQVSWDGSKIYFRVKKPIPGIFEDSVYAIWTIQETGKGWSEPEPIIVTADAPVPGGFSVSRNGNIYRSLQPEGETYHRIYRYQYKDGEYGQPEQLQGQINSFPDFQSEPFVDPAESLILFSAYDGGHISLYVSYRQEDATWGAPIRLGIEVNSSSHFERFPSLSRDEKYLFYIRSELPDYGEGNPTYYWISSDVLPARP